MPIKGLTPEQRATDTIRHMKGQGQFHEGSMLPEASAAAKKKFGGKEKEPDEAGAIVPGQENEATEQQDMAAVHAQLAEQGSLIKLIAKKVGVLPDDEGGTTAEAISPADQAAESSAPGGPAF